MNKDLIWEAVKEPLRILLLAVIPFGLAYFQVIDAQWALVITALLRLIDKILHDIGKEADIEILKRGLTKF